METLTRNVVQNWGDEGERWLKALPELVESQAAAWGVRVLKPYPMTFHWVAEVAREDGSKAVLKLGVADGHLDAEAEALRIFDGRGAVRLLASDPGQGAFLLEKADPGTPLTVADESALVGVGRRLHRVPPDGCALPHVRSLRGGFERYRGGLIPRRMVDRAAELFDDLCDSAPRETVLHGDLHHGNVMRGRRAPWMAIDPHGLVGDPGYDGGAMLYNPDPEDRDPALLKLVPGRLERMADGGEPMDRVVAWGFVMGVLSQIWTGERETRALDVGRRLEPRLA